MAYRLQNHALDIMSLPTSTEEALFLTVNAPHQASCVHVPRLITCPEFLKLLPKSWVTAYEKTTHKPTPVQSSNPTFHTKPDGSVEISFLKNSTSSSPHPEIFPSQINMFVDSTKPSQNHVISIPVSVPVLIVLQNTLPKMMNLFPNHDLKNLQTVLPKFTCFPPVLPGMQKSFLPWNSTTHNKKTTHRHKIPNSKTILPDGSTKSVSAAEAAINWQAENSLAQNRIINRIARSQQNLEATMQRKLSSLELLIHDLQQKVQSVHNELLQMAYANQTFSAVFYHKDAEMKHLKA